MRIVGIVVGVLAIVVCCYFVLLAILSIVFPESDLGTSGRWTGAVLLVIFLPIAIGTGWLLKRALVRTPGR